MTRMLRALEADRISVHNDVSTSLTRQNLAVENYCDSRSIKIIGKAVDDGVSASKVGPFDRPDLGPWLTDPVKINSYDVIVWWRMDRAVRSMTDLHLLADWAKKHNKRLVFAEGLGGNPLEFDMSSPISIMLMTFLAFAAEMEAQAIKERVQSSHSYLATQPRWPGGTPPYGYRTIDRIVDGKAAGKTLELDPQQAKIVREMADLLIGGESLLSIATLLNTFKVPPPCAGYDFEKGDPIWRTSTLGLILRSRRILGQKEVKGEPVYQADGEPLMLAEPILTEEVFRQVQQALTARAGKSRVRNTSPLLGIVHCGLCQAPAYRQAEWTNPKTGWAQQAYYKCAGDVAKKIKSCKGTNIFEWELTDRITQMFLENVGPFDRPERKFIPGCNNTAELENVENALDNLEAQSDAGLIRDRQKYLERLTALTAKRDRLLTLPSEPDRWEEVPSGKTWGEWWEESTPMLRRDLLLEAGFKVRLFPGRATRAYWPGKSGLTEEEFLASVQV